jgi:hypothetical protein
MKEDKYTSTVESSAYFERCRSRDAGDDYDDGDGADDGAMCCPDCGEPADECECSKD